MKTGKLVYNLKKTPNSLIRTTDTKLKHQSMDWVLQLCRTNKQLYLDYNWVLLQPKWNLKAISNTRMLSVNWLLFCTDWWLFLFKLKNWDVQAVTNTTKSELDANLHKPEKKTNTKCWVPSILHNLKCRLCDDLSSQRLCLKWLILVFKNILVKIKGYFPLFKYYMAD